MIRNLWETNLLYEKYAAEVTPEFIKDIIDIGEEYESLHPEAHLPKEMRKNQETSYNLLSDPRPSCQLFKKMLKDRMLEMAKSEGFFDPEKIVFEAITNLRKFKHLQYSKPHTHRSVDYVAVLFVQVGECLTKEGEKTHQKMAGNRLHLLDPIPQRSRYLNHNMLHAIRPYAGTFIIHPAYVFHTTELNFSHTDLLALVTNIKVVDDVRNYERL